MTITSPYAARAEAHWKTHLPSRYAKLTRPEAFFNDLGHQIEARVDQAETNLLQGHCPTGSFLDNYRARQAARNQAEHLVLQDMLPPPEEDHPASS